MKFLLINENGAEFIEIENTNKAINEVLGWNDAWNVPTIKVRGLDFLCICSDLGKIKHQPISCISYDNLIEPKQEVREPFIVGAVLITKFNGIDDFKTLNDNDIEILKSRLYEHQKPYLKDYYKTILVID